MIVFFTDVVDPLAQSAVLAEIGALAHRHVVVCAFMNDAAVAHALTRPPASAVDAYATAVALGLEHERKTAAAVLTSRGVIVIDTPATSLSTATIDEYLRIKQRGLI